MWEAFKPDDQLPLGARGPKAVPSGTETNADGNPSISAGGGAGVNPVEAE